jgi:hypothetical protein
VVFNFGVIPVKATEILYKDSRIEYFVISWRLPGTFEIASMRIWQWKLSMASLKTMLNDYIGIPT